MLTRRQVLIAATGSAALRSRRLTGSFLLRKPAIRDGEGAVVRVRLVAADVSALEWTNGLVEQDTGQFVDMELEVGRADATVRWLPTRAHWSSRLDHGARGFVAGWAIPILTRGFIGFDPAWAWPPLHAAGAGQFFHLPPAPTAPLPTALASARAVYACFIGEWGDLMLARFAEMARAISGVIPADADFIFNGGYLLDAPPSVLLTAFAPRAGGRRS